MRLTLLLAWSTIVRPLVASPSGAYKYLVTFGDSYTDCGRAAYFINNGHAPPAGTIFPSTFTPTYTGGYTWAEYAANTNPNVTLFDYAVGGAQLSPSLIPHTFNGGPSQDVLEYQVPTYQTEVKNASLYPGRTANNTVYAMWIGVNDFGITGFLGGSERPNVDIAAWVNTTYTVIDQIYASGGRRFVLFNQAAIDLAPVYTQPGQYGYDNFKYFSNMNCYNTTDYVDKARLLTNAANTITDQGVQYQAKTANRWPGSTISVFNAHQLMEDLYNNPGPYLDPPAIVNMPYSNCLTSGCTHSSNPPSAYMWFEELHISDRTSFLIAANFNVTAYGAYNKYGTTYFT